jgi:hypothetical protein
VSKVPQFSEKFASGIASSSEHGADMVKPAVYPFKCKEWDLATARPACASNSPEDAARLSACRSVSG